MSGARRQQQADRVWQLFAAQVAESLGGWRRATADATGLPFSRTRILRRLGAAPLSLHELARAADVDAPAATVAVNDLEARGLVARTPHPLDRRQKLVSLTRAGRALVKKADRVHQRAPEAFARLTAKDLDDLARVLAKLKP